MLPLWQEESAMKCWHRGWLLSRTWSTWPVADFSHGRSADALALGRLVATAADSEDEDDVDDESASGRGRPDACAGGEEAPDSRGIDVRSQVDLLQKVSQVRSV